MSSFVRLHFIAAQAADSSKAEVSAEESLHSARTGTQLCEAIVTDKTILGTFCDGDFSISEIEVDGAPPAGENPSVTFKLTTPFGSEWVAEVILDGKLPVRDGTWVDRLEAGPEDEEAVSDLLYSVNACLSPFIISTRISPAWAEWLAEALEMTLEFNEDSDHDAWKLCKDGDEVFAGSSMHEVLAELERLAY